MTAPAAVLVESRRLARSESSLRVALLALVPFALVTALASAPVPACAEQWTQQDGPYGGSVIAVDRIGSGAVYALRNDAVFRTTNAGAHWQDVSANASTFTFLAMDVAENGAIWCGTSTRGVAWSLNGGASWTNNQITVDGHTGLGATIGAIGVDPVGRILAGGYRSVNQGATFTLMSIGGLAFAFDPAGNAIAGTSEGVFRSSNGGQSWTAANAGMTNEYVLAVAADGASGIWAGTLDGEVWHSTDAGVSWTLGGPGLSGTSIVAIEVLPGSVLVSSQGGGFFRTTDGGLTWNPAGASLGQILDMRYAAGDLWLGTMGQGVFHSADEGATAEFASAAEMNAPALTALAADAAGTLYLASMASGVFRSGNGGATWSPAASGLASLLVTHVAAGASDHAWAATWYGLFATTDGGDSWTSAGFDGQRVRRVVPRPADVLIAVLDAAQPTVQRSTDAGATWDEVWNSPLVFRLEASDVADDGTVLLGAMTVFGGLVLRSTDEGATWEEIDLGFQGVDAVAAGPGGLAWAATADNVVHRSTDGGVTWAALPPGGWPTTTTGSLTALDHGANGLLLVGSGDVYRSTDDGDTWAPFDDGFPPGALATFVAQTPPGAFAGTYAAGVFRLDGTTDVAAGPARDDSPGLRVSPNPFRASTRVSWELPRPAVVNVVVYDVMGRRVAELSPGLQAAGSGALSWDGRTTAGRVVGPGTYFVRWEADGRSAGAKVLRVR